METESKSAKAKYINMQDVGKEMLRILQRYRQEAERLHSNK